MTGPESIDESLAELDRLEKELGGFGDQLDRDEAELGRRDNSTQQRGGRGPGAPGRGPGTSGRGPGAPGRGPGASRGTGGPARDPRGQSPYGGTSSGRDGSTSGWSCIADGRSVYGFDVATGGGDVRGRSTVHIPGNGGTKDEASYQAMSSCGALMSANLSTDRAMHVDASAEGQWGVRVETQCHVTQCSPM